MPLRPVFQFPCLAGREASACKDIRLMTARERFALQTVADTVGQNPPQEARTSEESPLLACWAACCSPLRRPLPLCLLTLGEREVAIFRLHDSAQLNYAFLIRRGAHAAAS